MQLLRSHRCFGGSQQVWRHQSAATGTEMEFAIFLPFGEEDAAPRPVLFWLSGLTCTWANFTEKAGAQCYAASHGLILVCPDTSPRGTELPGEHEAYDFGSGAGFYIDATAEPWSRRYRMYSYVTDELPELVGRHFPADIGIAALSMLDGKVSGDCMPRHRHQEFIRFLKTIDVETRPHLDRHLIVDNYGTHTHPRVKAWLRRHPRFHLHFIPTSSSWLNMVERWFRELTDKRIRRGSFHNVHELVVAIREYIDTHNQKPRVFTWTASVESIWAKVAKCKEALDALH